MRAEPPFLVEIDDLQGTPTRGKSLEELVYEAVGIRVDRKED
jgi:predicted RNase H-like HicB family nuclease